MANRKISDLTALTATATGDLLPIVDISEAGAVDQNKKITVENLFKGIPGNVGIGTSSPSALLELSGTGTVFKANTTTATSTAISLQLGGYATSSNSGCFIKSHVNLGSTLASQLSFEVNGGATEAVRIDSSGRVGIGTTSPNTLLDVNGAITARGDGSQVGLYLGGGAAIRDSGTASITYLDLATGSASHGQFVVRSSNAYTERLRIDSSGGVRIQTSLYLRYAGISTSFLGYDPGAGAPTGGTVVIVNQGNDGSGSGATGVGLGRSATSWATYSDERGKTNLIPIEDGLSKIGTLRSVTGHYAEDLEQTSRSFLIAQDVQAVLPEAVDASDPDKLSLRYTEVIPLLVAALKESKERIETLEARLTAAGIA
jgi:hypothetical protein